MQKQGILNFIFIGGVALMLTGCASKPTTPTENPAIGEMLQKEVGGLDQTLAARIMAEPAATKSQSRVKVEGEINRKIWWWLRYYTVRERERFQRTIERGESYRPLVQQMLHQYQLPPELFYLALIESSFVTHATSAASAVGIWQFEKATALNYGLRIDGYDERQHPIASTQAAARYLTELHREFNSWYLAIAAYNAGQGRIRKAVREGHTSDFWKLAEGGFLPEETMEYIPKFLAAATIGSHLQNFGFEAVHPQHLWPEVEAVDLKPGMKLSHILRQVTPLSKKELLRLNPHLNYALSSGDAHIRIWLPRESAIHFAERKSTKLSKL